MATAFFRTIILYAVLIIGLRLTGKRQIGELEPNELVLTMLLSDLAAVPMQDFALPLVSGVLPIVTILSLSVLISQLSLRSVRFRALMCGEPATIIRNGKIQQQVMRRNRLTIDELMEELRCQGVTDLQTVKYAVLETSGQLSVLLYPDRQPLTPQQAGITAEDDLFIPHVIINDGRVLMKNLQKSGHSRAWLERQMKKEKIRQAEDIFLLTVDEKGHVVCILKEEQA